MFQITRYVNQRGIPCFGSDSVSVTSSAVVISFGSHPIVEPNFSGLIALNVTSSFDAPTTAVPVTMVMGDKTIALTDLNGTAVTSSTWTGTGIHIVFYDRTNNVLQIIK